MNKDYSDALLAFAELVQAPSLNEVIKALLFYGDTSLILDTLNVSSSNVEI